MRLVLLIPILMLSASIAQANDFLLSQELVPLIADGPNALDRFGAGVAMASSS